MDIDGGVAYDSRGHAVGQVGKSLEAFAPTSPSRREVYNCRFIPNLSGALHLRIIVRQRYVSNGVVHASYAGHVKG